MTYEYLIMVARHKLDGKTSITYAGEKAPLENTIQDALNDMGKQGWELVSVIPQSLESKMMETSARMAQAIPPFPERFEVSVEHYVFKREA